MPALAYPSQMDCKTTTDSVEKLICSDPALVALDTTMTQNYQHALGKAREPKRLQATQQGWIKGRNECWKSSDVAACVRKSYQLRIAELQVRYQLRSSLAPVVYHCKERSEPVTVTFYNDTQPPAAEIILGKRDWSDSQRDYQANNQIIAFIQPSGSGIRYSGVNSLYDVLFWGKGDAAMLTINGMEYSCQTDDQPTKSTISSNIAPVTTESATTESVTTDNGVENAKPTLPTDEATRSVTPEQRLEALSAPSAK